MIFASVDLPAPFSPTRPCTSPARSSKSTPRRARTPANSLTMPTARTAAGGCPAAVSCSLTGSGPLVLRLPLADVRLRQDPAADGLRDERSVAGPERSDRPLAGDQEAEDLVHRVEAVVVRRDDVRGLQLAGLDEIDP